MMRIHNRRSVRTHDASMLDFAGYYAPEKIGRTRRVTPEGFLILEGTPIARIGEQTYASHEINAGLAQSDPRYIKPDGSGLIRVKRLPEEVFHPETLASFEGKDYVIEHPPEGVNLDNWRSETVGHVQNVRRGSGIEDDLVLADIVVKDPAAIEYVNKYLPENSAGYRADYEGGGPGWAIQRNIIGNHVAAVRFGRAGARVAVRDHSMFGAQMKTQFRTRDAQLTVGGAAWDGELKPRVDSTISAIESMLVVDPVPPILDPGQVWTGNLLRRFDQLAGATGDDKVDISQVAREVEGLHKAMGTVPLDTRAVQDSIRRVRKAADAACGSQQYGKETTVQDALRHARGATNTQDQLRSIQAANAAFWRDQPTRTALLLDEMPRRHASQAVPPAPVGARPTLAEMNAANRAFWANR